MSKDFSLLLSEFINLRVHLHYNPAVVPAAMCKCLKFGGLKLRRFSCER